MEAAFFDLDKTIISRSSSLALSRPMYRAGMVTRGQLVRGAYAQLVYALVGADEKKMDRLKEGCSSSRGVGPARGRTPRRGRPDRRDRPVRVPGGPRPDGAAPLRGTGHLHRELLARGGRPSARAALRRGGRARDARALEDGRYTGELEFYCYGDAQGRGDPVARRGSRDRARVVVRVQRFLDRPPDAADRRSSRRGQPGPGTPQGGRDRGLGHPATSGARSGSGPGSSRRPRTRGPASPPAWSPRARPPRSCSGSS